MSTAADHRELAEELRGAVSRGLDPDATTGAMRIGAGGEADLAPPYAELARTIGAASYKVTDEQVAAARQRAGSDRGAFEVVMSAGIGAALRRWNAAIRAIDEAGDAAR